LRVLDRGQRTRLDQIQLQAKGPLAITRSEVRKRLNMAPEQVEAIVSVVDEGRQEIERVATVPNELLENSTPLPGGVLKFDPARAKAIKSAVEKSK
jgi:hypothetical protein